MDYSSLLNQLSARLGVSLEIDENGATAISFDNENVEFFSTKDGIYLLCELGFVTANDTFLRDLLVSNAPGKTAAGATISIDSTIETYNMHRLLPADMPYNEFEQALVSFIKAAREVKKIIYNRASDSSDTEGTQRYCGLSFQDFLNSIQV